MNKFHFAINEEIQLTAIGQGVHITPRVGVIWTPIINQCNDVILELFTYDGVANFKQFAKLGSLNIIEVSRHQNTC